MEEVGKAMQIYASIVLQLLGTQKDRNKFIRTFRDHKEKAQSARSLTIIVVDTLRKGNPELAEKMTEWTLNEFSESDNLNKYKNYSLYTSFKDGVYQSPREVITAGKVNYIELMSQNRLNVAKAFLSIWLPNIDKAKEFAKNNPLTEEQMVELAVKTFFGT
jgi:AbiV family abortive infection protein